jgi:hypothetical protein
VKLLFRAAGVGHRVWAAHPEHRGFPMGTTRPLLLLQDPEKLAQEVAQQLTDKLDGSERMDISKPVEARYPLLGDVEFAIEELHNVLMWASRAQTRIACIREDDGFAPVIGVPLGGALLRRFPLDHLPPHSGFSHESFHYERLLGQFLRPDEILWALPGEVPEMVFFPLLKFLAVRFQWLAGNPGFQSALPAPPASASTESISPYLPFTVETLTSGLRIHYSNTFAINFNHVFGAVTTPLKGWILPGTYRFAGMDRMGNFLYDRSTFSTPPDRTANLMI